MKTYLLGTLEGVVSRKSNGKEVLVRVDERVHDGDDRRVVDGKRDGRNGGDTREEAVEELLVRDVEDIGGEDVALVEDLDDSHTVGERGDVQHVEKGRLGRPDTGTGGDHLDLGHDFDGTTSDLGGDTESLEERSLTRLHTGVASRDPDIGGSDGTGTGWGGNLVVKDLVTDGLEVAVGEDEADVALDVRQELLVLGGIGNEGLQGSAHLK